MTREEFLTASEIALERLITPLKELPDEVMDEPLAEGKWSPKLLLLHLTYWDTLVVRALESLYRGEQFDWSPYEDTESFNRSVIADRQRDPYKRVATELRIVHSTLMAAVERIPSERFGPEGELPDWLPSRVAEHYLAHVPLVESWAKKIRDSGRGGPTGLPIVQ